MTRSDVTAVRELLDLTEPPVDVAVDVIDSTQLHGHQRLRLEIACADGDTMPAFLLVPEGARGAAGVVVFHQHASQWHLGKSEVCGLAGDPTQAFGPALVDAGLVVLAPDAVAFEDRRRTTSGTEPHPDDRDQQERELSYRLLHGRTLGGKVIADAQTALSALRERPEVDAGRVGVLGHSFGGNTVIFHAAVDERVAFASTSGAAGTYRNKIVNEIGIDRAEVIPGVLDVVDIDDLTRLICPRPLGIFAGNDDRYAHDAADVIAATRTAYRTAQLEDGLHGEIVPGGHALTPERSRAITDWVIRTALITRT
jgi:dienelactone hydrolase